MAAALDTSTLPPGPRGPRLLTVARFLLQPERFIPECRERYGPLFTITLSPDRTIIVCGDPAVAKEVFTGDPALLHAGAGNVVLRPLLGARSVLLLDGPEHLRQRRLMLPPFHGERMRGYGERMRTIAERHVSQWPVGESFAVHPSMQAITLEVILRVVFGVEDAARVAQLSAPLRQLLDSTTQPRRLLGLQFTRSQGARPRTPWGRVKRLMAPVDRMVYEEIAARRAEAAAGGEPHDDILSLLLEARDEQGEPLTDLELRDELMTLLLAGHETTATALAWTLERITRHPHVLARLQDEAGDPAGAAYLDAVMTETLRLRPVVPAVVRKLQAPLTFGGWELPAGVNIAPNIWLIHRDPALYPEPEAFRPERFLGRRPGTYEWIPFGGGIRRCLGASFALYEMRVVLETILAQARLAPNTAAAERVTRRFVTFTPADGGRITVASRRTPAGASPAPLVAA
ncbi:cytochrome P450 [Conexibacter stalactiti]|uniref:Cytochrome P450 n=1 Tax=Conexibacter stalactiti TaxID=1940611 RepID=A0ABU4HHP0_9ACTN|nr:cytochrome P450 [Conexibacter stalactiti]MDW5592825.1 cytochrome P450 [Conexibacter stalactiti]MEC5033466.1 cytochrome P450 [Conexibacter stalactiti]